MRVPLVEFAVLYIASLLGALSLTPYLMRLLRSATKPVKAAPATVALAAFAQNAVFFALVVYIGLLTAHTVGRGAPYVEAVVSGAANPGSLASVMSIALLSGAAGGVFLTAADLILLPRMPALLDLACRSSPWENLGASVYGAVNEELLTRLLGVSALTWLFSQGWRGGGAPSTAAVALAVVVMAVVFSLGHLPMTRAVAGRITPLVLFRALALNSPIAVLCGWLFWRFGLEAAILAHLSVDLVYLVGGTALLRANNRSRFLPWFPATEVRPGG